MVAKVKKKTPKKKDLRIASAKKDKPEWPKMVMGVKVTNQEQMNKMINSMYGRPNSYGGRGSLGS